MTKILVTYHSHDGQTAKIAEHVAERLRSHHADVDVVNVERAPEPTSYDVAVVGGSIRFSRHSRAVVRWLRRHQQVLGRMPVALFQVSMTSARTDARHTTESERLVEQLAAQTHVHPQVVGLLAGALRYTQYGWVTRRVMRSIARREGNATDLTRDHEYTDWAEVDRFADQVAALAVVDPSQVEAS
jgi:menaquinone-dependent protoporphyrinogen oxidase